jgi:hypothetical protein
MDALNNSGEHRSGAGLRSPDDPGFAKPLPVPQIVPPTVRRDAAQKDENGVVGFIGLRPDKSPVDPAQELLEFPVDIAPTFVTVLALPV